MLLFRCRQDIIERWLYMAGKPKFDKPMNDKITVRIPQDNMKQLNELSKKTNQPVRDIVRQSIQETLKNKGQ